mmetsp:Transcript_19013/g.31170  ORF Transcript_19013/g.31170 Transcript_19013/m.31170 type:complete len:747 (-) Transcript_19013:439-2679(-)
MGQSGSTISFQQCIVALTEKHIEAADEVFWRNLFSLPNSAEDVFGSVRPTDVRQVKQKVPENLGILLQKAVDILEKGDEKTPLLINAIRLLTRVIPFILEDNEDGLEDRLLWGSVSGVCLATRLMNAVSRVCFLPNFTIAPIPKKAAVATEGAVNESLVWANGVHIHKASSSWSALDRNRVEVLRLLLVMGCQTLYFLPQDYSLPRNRWLEYLTCETFPHGKELFYSLLNVVVSYDPVGWGTPYNSLLTDTSEAVMNAAIQVLLVLLDYQPTLQSTETAPGETDQIVASEAKNLFRDSLLNIKESADMELVFSAMQRLLNSVWLTQMTYIPGSVRQIQCHQELLVLLWHVLDMNKAMLQHFLRQDAIVELVVPILYFLSDSRKDQGKLGVVHISVFILLLLSGERDFCVALNAPFLKKLPIRLPLFTGNHADLMILILHQVITNGVDRLQSLYSCMLTILCNITPYVKTLSRAAAGKLLHLSEVFALPRYLFANENNHHYVFFLLDSLNNIIQYQYEGNSNVVYSILRKSSTFEELLTLTIPASISQDPAPHPASLLVDDEAPLDPAAPAPTESLGPSVVSSLPDHHGVESRRDSVSRSNSVTEGTTAGPGTLPNPAENAGSSVQQAVQQFVPTAEWLNTWRPKLPLQTIIRLIRTLLPQVEDFCKRNEKDGNVVDESMVVEFIQKTTMVGLLPVPHPILMRKYQANQYTGLWFTTYLYGVIYLRNQSPALFDGNTVKLFTITYVR